MHRPKRLAAAVAGLATAGAVALATTGATAHTGTAAAAKKITGKGVGALRIGMLQTEARAMGFVGQARPGCELVPNSRFAKLLPPLKGTVDLTTSTPRRVRNIHITGGNAAARGVRVGDTLADAKAAYPGGRTNKDNAELFGRWFYHVGKKRGGPLVFEVKPGGTHAIVQIDVRSPAFCE